MNNIFHDKQFIFILHNEPITDSIYGIAWVFSNISNHWQPDHLYNGLFKLTTKNYQTSALLPLYVENPLAQKLWVKHMNS